MYIPLMTLVLIATVASCTFTLLYGIKSPWYRNRVGKMQFTKSVCLSATLLLTIINALADYPYQEYVSFVVLLALCAALVVQVIVLVKEQKEARRRFRERTREVVK